MRAGAYDYLVKPFVARRGGPAARPRARGAGAAPREPRPPPGWSTAGAARIRQPGHAAGARDRAAGGGVGRDRAAHRRERDGQERARRRDARLEPASPGPVRHRLVHDAGRASARERALRPREGRVHRRLEGQAAGGSRRARRRHACSSTRSASCRPTCRGSSCASSRSTASSASAARDHARGRRAHHRRDEPRSRSRGAPPGASARTSSFVCNVIGIRAPAAARAPGGPAGARRAPPAQPVRPPPPPAAWRSRRRRSPRCEPTRGRETCASW